MKVYYFLVCVILVIAGLSCTNTKEIKHENTVVPAIEFQSWIGKTDPPYQGIPFNEMNERFLMGYSDQPVHEFWFSDEYVAGTNETDGTSRIVEDLGAVCDESPTTTVNYVLIVDKKKCLITTDEKRARIFSIPLNARSEEDISFRLAWGNYSATYSPTANDIGSPLGCELIDSPDRSYIYSLVADQSGGYNLVKMFKHQVNPDGSLSPIVTRIALFTDDIMTSVRGVSCVMFADNNDNFDYLVAICDPANKKVRIFDESQSLISSLDLGSDRPYDVTIAKYSATSIFIYTAVLSSSRYDDYVNCYEGTLSGGSWSFSSGSILKYQGIYQPELAYLTNICVLEYGDYPNWQLCLLMWDTNDGYGIRLSQVTLGYNYQFDWFGNFWNFYPSTAPIFNDGLALGKSNYNDNTGYFYFVGDKDPGYNFTGNGGSGENVFVYQNTGQ